MPLTPPPRLAANLFRWSSPPFHAGLQLQSYRGISQCLRSVPSPYPSSLSSFARLDRCLGQRRTFLTNIKNALPKNLPSSFFPWSKNRTSQSSLLKPAPGEKYGQQIQIYRIGLRSVLLGPLKIYAVLQFAYCVGYVIPNAWDPDEWWWSAGAAAASLVPLGFLAYLGPPYVSNIYLKLPAYARRTRESLYAYVANLPPDAVLQMVTVRVTARPMYTPVFLGDIAPTKKRFGCVNLIGQLRGAKEGKEKYFYVDPRRSPSKVDEPVVMKEVMKAIEKFSKQKESVGKIDPKLKWWEHLSRKTAGDMHAASTIVVKTDKAPVIKVAQPGAVRKVVRKMV